MVDRLISLGMALCLAFLIWLYARGRDQESLDNVPVPVQLALAPGQEEHYLLEITGSSQVLVSFTGTPSRIRELRGMLQRGEIRVGITLDVPEDRQNESRFLDTVRVEAADIHAPPGVTAVVAEGRNRIPVTLHRLVERRLPVRFEHSAEDELGTVTVEPATVLVRGPQDVLEQARAIPTQLWMLPQRNDAALGQEIIALPRVPLVRDLEGRSIRTTPAAVGVRVAIRPKQKAYTLADVPVAFLCPANFALRAQLYNNPSGKIGLRVIGPASDVPPAVTAYIDLTGKYDLSPGLQAEEPIRVQLPTDFQLAQDPPKAPFELRAPDGGLKGAGKSE